MGRAKKPTNWQDVNVKILAGIDLRSEFEALGVHITGREPNPDGWLACRAIDREDRTPSACVNVATGRYRDLGGQGLSLSFWDLVVGLGRAVDWKTARAIYAKRAGVELVPDSRDPAEHLTFLPWNSALGRLWCRTKPGVTPEAILASGGRQARYRGQFAVVALPVFGAAGVEADPTGWVLFNVTGRELPIYQKGAPPVWRKMKTTAGSEAGLVGQHALDRLGRPAAEDPDGLVVWKVEGPSDALALWTAVPPELRDRHLVLTNAGGSNQQPRDWMAAPVAGRAVYVVHDADQAGEKGGDTWAAWAAKHAREARRVRLPYEVAADHGKDLRDWFAEGHTYAELLELAQAAEVITPPADAQANGQADRQAIREAEDDPHRLARINLERYATNTDGRTLRYWRDEWYVWKHNHYRAIGEAELRAKLTASVKEEFDRLAVEKLEAWEAALEAGGADEDSSPPEARKVTRQLTTNVLAATGSMVCVSADVELATWLPTRERKNYISLQNGILDVDRLLADRDDCMVPNSPAWWSMTSLPYQFEPDATCPIWDRFLEHNLEMDPERIKVVQEWAGYLLLPDTREQKFMVLEGEGSNGKSVFITGLTAMLGEANVSNVQLEIFGDRFARTDTLGKLLNAAGDCGELDNSAEGYIKSFTSGDRMFFDRKGVPGINCRPTARLMLACNNRPRFSDRSQGLWRRMLLVPWRIEVADDRKIKGMDKVEWWYESGQLPGMFRWALVGLARLRAQGGFTRSALMDEALIDYQEEMNPTRVFLKQHLEPAKDNRIRASRLYEIYRSWANENGYMPLSERPFGKEVRRCFQGVERRNGGTRIDRYYYYTGIAFSQDEIAGENTSDATLF